MSKKAAVEAVDVDADLIPEGDERGCPTARFCGETRRWYHLDCSRRRVYDECPAGYEYDDLGNCVPVKEAPNG